MKNLTLSQLNKWKPCNGQDWVGRLKKEYGKSVEWGVVVKVLTKEKEYSALGWIIGKRLEKLNKRQICAFAYRCAHRSLKYARKQDLEVLKKAISFPKQCADTGKVDRAAARAAAGAAAWAAGDAAWAAGAAAGAAGAAARAAARAAGAAAGAARAAAWAAWAAARAAAWAAWAAGAAAECRWQFAQLLDIEENWKGKA